MNELRRILYVEDEPDIREITRLALELVGGYEVQVCASGREALQQLQDFTPDFILLDVMMPDMDGPTTLLHLRERARDHRIRIGEHVMEAHLVPLLLLRRRVDDLVERHGVNKRTLQRLFAKYVGVTPKWVIQRYRLRPYTSDGDALADTKRSIRLVRYHAKEWGVDPGRIGIMGFSAGGEQAAAAGAVLGVVRACGGAGDQLHARPHAAGILPAAAGAAEPFTEQRAREHEAAFALG